MLRKSKILIIDYMILTFVVLFCVRVFYYLHFCSNYANHVLIFLFVIIKFVLLNAFFSLIFLVCFYLIFFVFLPVFLLLFLCKDSCGV